MCKQIKNVLRVFPFLCLILSGCEKGDGYGERFFSKSFITDYVYPDTLETYGIETVGDTMSVRMGFKGNYHVAPLAYRNFADWEQREHLFDSLMVRYADTTYNEDVYVEGHKALANPIESITVVSDADYDENHVAGSDLSDLVIFQGFSYGSFVLHGYFREEDSYWIYYNGNGAELNKPLSEFCSEDYHLWKFSSFELKFPQPTLSQVHHITFTFVTGGQTFTVTEELDFND